MYAQDLRESYQDFRHCEDEGDSDDRHAVEFMLWQRDNRADHVVHNFSTSVENTGEEEEDGDPAEIDNNDGDDDDGQPVDDIDDTNNDAEEDPRLHHRGPQRVIPHGKYRGAD